MVPLRGWNTNGFKSVSPQNTQQRGEKEGGGKASGTCRQKDRVDASNLRERLRTPPPNVSANIKWAPNTSNTMKQEWQNHHYATLSELMDLNHVFSLSTWLTFRARESLLREQSYALEKLSSVPGLYPLVSVATALPQGLWQPKMPSDMDKCPLAGNHFLHTNSC